MKPKVVVAEDELITRLDLVEIIEEAGYPVVGQAKDGFDAIEICRKERPDVILMDIKMPLLDGLQATKIIKEENLAKCIVLVTAYSDQEYIKEAKKLGVMNYLVKPFDESTLIPAIEIAASKQEELESIKKKLTETEKKLDDRIVIDRAKGILMDKHKCLEEEAYQSLRKLAMNKRTTLAHISEIIVKTMETGR